jgi:TonB family protein
MSDAWAQCIGQLIDGKFLLLQYLGGSEHSGVFLTERQEGGKVQQAAIKLTPASPDCGERQLARWRRAAKLSHRHLIRLFEMGHCELGGAALLYVVMEYADENVASVLPRRALTPAEARTLLDSVLDVLAYLHDKGLVHGHIRPANILADGDQVKVSSDEILQAGEVLDVPGRPDAYDPPEYARANFLAAQAASREGDVWSLAMTLGEALTQRILAMQATAQADAPLPSTLSEPFLDIVRHCLRLQPEDRWTLDTIAGRLHGRSVAPAQLRTRWQHARPHTLRHVMSRITRSRYTILIATGLALLVTILAGSRLFHHRSGRPQAPTATIEEPNVEPLQKQEAKPPEPRPNKVVNSDPSEIREDSKTPAPVPTSPRTDTAHEDSGAGKATLDVGGMVPGAVLQQVLPDVLPKARTSIRGTVRVDVTVDVDSLGSVRGATLTSPGPSKYFARLALQSARRWRFAPAKVAGQDVLRRWTLHFEFTPSQTTVVPKQDIP